MAMIRKLMLCLLLMGFFSVGCRVDGERTFELEIFGSTIRIHDRAHMNEKGEQHYRVGTIADDALTKLFTKPETEDVPE